MQEQTLWIISTLAAGTLLGVFCKMNPGFGPMNLRVVGIVLVAFLSSILAISNPDTLNAAMGILGAIAGYLFGTKDKEKTPKKFSSAEVTESTFGDNTKIAGRDINETINNIEGKLDSLGDIISKESANIDKLVLYQQRDEAESYEYLLNTIYERQLSEIQSAISKVIQEWESQGWRLVSLTSDYQGMDGIFLLFKRPSNIGHSTVRTYHSSRMSEVD